MGDIIAYNHKGNLYKDQKTFHSLSQEVKNHQLFISENLCPAYLDECHSLKYEKVINTFCSVNGILDFKLSEDLHERPKKVELYEKVDTHNDG